MLGVSVGGRISELLALKVNDVWQNGKPVKDLLFDRNIVKGGEVSRAVPVNVDGREAIENLITWQDGALWQYQSDPSAVPVPERARLRGR